MKSMRLMKLQEVKPVFLLLVDSFWNINLYALPQGTTRRAPASASCSETGYFTDGHANYQ
jgi:hypothetical protein